MSQEAPFMIKGGCFRYLHKGAQFITRLRVFPCLSAPTIQMATHGFSGQSLITIAEEALLVIKSIIGPSCWQCFANKQ